MELRLGMLNFGQPFDRLCQPKPNRWGVAKLVRRLTLDQVILGSNPSAPAIAFIEAGLRIPLVSSDRW